jgi:RNA polymerase sigma-70 factor (ECF subfamily)
VGVQASKPLAGMRPSGNQAVVDEDLVLLDRILTGDGRAFEELVHRHEHHVYRVALGIIGNHEDAEEATQQTFLRVYQHLGGFQRSSKFATWMTRIAINEALQIRRRRRPTVSLDDLQVTDEGVMPKELRDWHDDPGKIYDKQQIREIVERAIQSLPTIYREAFVLRDVQGLTSEESAAALGIGVSSLKTRLLRARLMMREALAVYLQRKPTLKSRATQVRWKLQDVLLARMRRVIAGKEEGSK